MRVLVACEDVSEQRRAVTALHLYDDVEVVEVASSADARQLLVDQGERFDVLVLDGDLTQRGGYALLYDLRARLELSGDPAPPAIVMASRQQDLWLAGWAGASEILLKPVDPFELARRVAALKGTAPAPYGDSNAASAQLASAIRDHGTG